MRHAPLVFPLQLTVLPSEPARDFSGGEFVLVEQRPRAQSKAEMVPLAQGEAVIFAVHHRSVRGTRGWYRVMLRHGVSRVRAGSRHTLGVIFHDARSGPAISGTGRGGRRGLAGRVMPSPWRGCLIRATPKRR
jgi:hypothetical protein